MVILDTIKYKTINIQKEDLQNCLIQVHLQIYKETRGMTIFS